VVHGEALEHGCYLDCFTVIPSVVLFVVSFLVSFFCANFKFAVNRPVFEPVFGNPVILQVLSVACRSARKRAKKEIGTCTRRESLGG